LFSPTASALHLPATPDAALHDDSHTALGQDSQLGMMMGVADAKQAQQPIKRASVKYLE